MYLVAHTRSGRRKTLASLFYLGRAPRVRLFFILFKLKYSYHHSFIGKFYLNIVRLIVVLMIYYVVEIFALTF